MTTGSGCDGEVIDVIVRLEEVFESKVAKVQFEVRNRYLYLQPKYVLWRKIWWVVGSGEMVITSRVVGYVVVLRKYLHARMMEEEKSSLSGLVDVVTKVKKR